MSGGLLREYWGRPLAILTDAGAFEWLDTSDVSVDYYQPEPSSHSQMQTDIRGQGGTR